jgi:hypothetical protein
LIFIVENKTLHGIVSAISFDTKAVICLHAIKAGFARNPKELNRRQRRERKGSDKLCFLRYLERSGCSKIRLKNVLKKKVKGFIMKKTLTSLMALATVGLLCSCEYDGRSEDRSSEQGTQPTNESSTPSTTTSSDFPSGTQWIFGSDISGWAQTINLSSPNIRRVGGHEPWEVSVKYDRLQDIPADNEHNVNGSIWLIREFEGQWYAGTIDYLRVGQMSKGFNTSAAYKLLPQSGDRIGVMVSTMNRSYDGTIVRGDPRSPYRERSNIAWTTWP